MKIHELMTDFKEYLEFERVLSPQTLSNYISDLRKLGEFIEDKEVQDISRDDIRAYLRSIRSSGLSVATMRRRIHSANTFFKWLQLNGQIEEIPTKGVKLPKRSHRQPAYLSEDELKHFVRTPSPYSLAWYLLAHLGLRSGELISLRWEDMKLKRWSSFAIIRETKNKRDRTIPLGDDLELIVMDAWEQAGKPQSGYIFPHEDGHWQNYQFRRDFRKHIKACGFNRRITSHAIRHSFASHLMLAGVDIMTIKELLGHSDISTTAIYVHLSTEIKRNAVNRLKLVLSV